MTSDFGCGTELFPLSALLNRRHTETKDAVVTEGTVLKVSELKTRTWMLKVPDERDRVDFQVLNDTEDDVTLVYMTEGRTDTHSVTLRPDRELGMVKATSRIWLDGHETVLYSDPADIPDLYWSHFGIEHVELPVNTPLTHAIWERVCLRFNESFYDRFLAGETMEQWQRRLQVITDRTIPTYERALRIYAENAGEIDTVTGVSQTTEYLNVKDASKGKSRGRVAETPDTAVNEDQSYAGSVSDGSNESENVKTGKVRTTMTVSGGLAEVLNANIDAWRDLETELVDEYRQAFLSLVWY